MPRIGQVVIEFTAKTDQLQGQIDGINRKLDQVAKNGRRAAQGMDEGVTKMQAASAAIRSLNGDLNTRAVERYLAQFEGLSNFLQKAFPVVGAIALTGIVVRLGEEIYKTGEKAITAGQNIQNAFNKMNGTMETANDSLRITNDALQDQLDKLDGKRPNVLKDTLDDARKAADELADALEGDSEKIDEIVKKYHVGLKEVFAAAVQFKNIGTTNDVEKIFKADDQENEDGANYIHDATRSIKTKEDAKRAQQVIQARLDALNRQTEGYKKLLASYKAEQSASPRNGIDPLGGSPFDAFSIGTPVDNTPAIKELEGHIRSNQDMQEKYQLMMQEAQLKPKVKAKTDQNEDARKAKELEHQQTEALVQSWRERLDKLKNERDLNAADEYRFWALVAKEARDGSNEYSHAVNSDAWKTAYKEMGTTLQAVLKEQKAADKKILDEQASTAEALQKNAGKLAPALIWGKDGSLTVDQTDHPYGMSNDDALKRSAEITRQYETLQATMAKATREAGEAFAEQAVQIALASGQISKHDAAVQLAQIHAVAFKNAIDEMTTERAKLIDDNRDGVNNNEINRLTAEINKAEATRPIQQAADEDKIVGPLDAAKDAINLWTQAATDSATQLRQIVDTTLGGFNDAVVNSNKRGVFQQYGQNLFKNLEKTGLERAEGYGLKAFGFGGGKSDGSAAAPWHVIVDGLKQGASALFGKGASGISGLASTFGQATDNANSSGSGGLLGAFLKIGGGILGFADGGDPPLGVPSLVGENGPELFVPRSAGTVVPNGKYAMGTTHNWNVDARGSNDPAGTARMIKEAMETTHKKAVHDAVTAVHEHRVRRASTAH